MSVAALITVFFFAGLDRSDKLGSIIGALTGVVGLAISSLGFQDRRRARADGSRVSLSQTGSITSRGNSHGLANTGYIGHGQSTEITLRKTGKIDRDAGSGPSNTGYMEPDQGPRRKPSK